MATTWKAPTWRMPNEKNQSKFESYSLNFNGSSEYINCGNPTELQITGALTLSAWIKSPALTGTNQGILYKDDGTNRCYKIQLQGLSGSPLGRFTFSTFSSGVVDHTEGTTNLADNNWHHVVAVYTPSTSVVLYVDGVVQTTNTTSIPASIDNDPADFEIGRKGNGTLYFNGSIVEGCVFNYALNIDQVLSLYNSGSPINPMTLKPAPIAYYPLGGNASTGGDPLTATTPNTLSVPNIAVPDASVFDFPGSGNINTGNVFSDIITGSNKIGICTISYWAKCDSAGVQANLMQLVNGATYLTTNSGFRMDTFNRPVYISNPSGRYVYFDVISNPTEWNHWCWVFTSDTSYGGGDLKFYLNGQESSIGYDHSATPANQPWDGFYINGWQAGGLSNFEMSNLQLWNVNLSDTEITTLYNNGVPLLSGTQPQAANLKAWYKLDQSANWEADAASTWQIPDAVSSYPQSFDFSGTDYIKVNNSPSIEPAKNLTVSVWVNWKTGSNTYSYAINKDYDGSNGSYAITRVNQPRFYIFTSTGVVISPIASSVNLTDTGWHHLVGTYDGSYVRFYVDGEEIGSGTAETGDIIYNTGDLIIGAYQSSGNLSPNGEQSNVQIWDSALSSSQVTQLYNNGVPLTTAIASDNLKAWYKLNDNEKFDGTNWEVENQKYPANYSTAYSIPNTNNDNNASPYGGNSKLISGGSFLSVADSILAPSASALSISCWVKLDNPDVNFYDNIVCQVDGAVANSFRVMKWRNNGTGNWTFGTINFALYSNDTTAVNVNVDKAQFIPQANTWFNIICTYDGITMRVFINNKLCGSGTSMSGNFAGNTNNRFIIGKNANSIYGGLQGAVSNVQVWNSTLTGGDGLSIGDQGVGEIAQLYNNGTPLASSIPQASSLLGWWKLESDLNDSSANNKTLTAYGNEGGNANSISPVPSVVSSFVSSLNGISSGMTEQNLVNNNVSTLNGESSGMTSANLVTSTLTRQIPYNNYSMYFDGSLDYIDCGNNSSLNINGDLTISAWVNIDIHKQLNGIISKVSSTDRNYEILVRNTGQVTFYTSPTEFTTSTQAITVNTWTNIIVTVESGVTNGVKFYFNGVQDSTTGTQTVVANTANLNIGRRTTGGFVMDGKISNISIFNETLTSTEVQKLYNSGVPSDLSSFNPSPTAWWSLGSDSYFNGNDWICPDLVSTNNGTSSGMDANALIGDAPNSTGNGTSTNMAIDANLTGSAPNSSNNSFSVNMGYTDRETSVPS